MRAYTALNREGQKKSRKPLCIGTGLLLIFVSVSTTQLLPALLGLLFVYLAFYKKTMVIDENGISVYYDGIFYKSRVSYGFGEMSGLLVDHGDDETVVAFIRNNTTTYAAFKPDDGKEVVKLAQKGNSRLKVDYIRIKKNKMSL